MEECIICFYETTNFVVFECTHQVCVHCYPRLQIPLCPICSRRIVIPSSPTYSFSRNHCLIYGGIIIICATVATILWNNRNVVF
jgi:hypothetical protein